MIKPEEIKHARTSQQLSIQKAAEIADVNPNTWGRYEHGKIANPRPDVLQKIVGFVSKFEKKQKRSQPEHHTPTLRRTKAKQLKEMQTISHVQTPTVRALIKYEVLAEVSMDVEEKVLSLSPLKTDRVYSNVRDLKVLENGFAEGKMEFIKIISENPVNQEPAPNYV